MRPAINEWRPKKWAKSSDFNVNTQVLKGEVADFATFNQGYCT